MPPAGSARSSAGAVEPSTGAVVILAAPVALLLCPLQVATGCAARSTGVAANSEAGTVVSRAVLFTNLSAMSTALSADARLGAWRVFCPATARPDVLVCLLSPVSLDAAGLHMLAAASHERIAAVLLHFDLLEPSTLQCKSNLCAKLTPHECIQF